MKLLNERQRLIIEFVTKHPQSSMRNIFAELAKDFDVSERTIVRDLSFLNKKGVLDKIGEGRNVSYLISAKYKLCNEIDIDLYFANHHTERSAKHEFDFHIFDLLSDGIFDEKELKNLENINQKYLKQSKKLKKESPVIYKKELERLVIELSWKSSQIEGNTYSLLETEALLKELVVSEKHNKAETMMIINHKKSLDLIIKKTKTFQEINVEKIKKLHEILLEDLYISFDFRDKPVGITGTLYRPLPRKKNIKKAIEKLVILINSMKNAYDKAFIALILISYIQPFEDGNKRTGRILSNAILHANQKSMLSYRDINVIEYKKAMLLFYEQNNLSHIKKIFVNQFKFAIENYFSER